MLLTDGSSTSAANSSSTAPSGCRSVLDDLIAGLLGASRRLSRPSRAKGFAFVIHPRDLRDVARQYTIARYLPSPVVSAWTRSWPPLIAGPVTGVRSVATGAEIPGWIVICPLTPNDLLANRHLALRRIRSAIALARRHGATIVGLGGLLPAVTGGGTALRADGGPHIATGRALTPIVMTNYVVECAALAGWNLAETVVAVVGAAGGVGSAAAALLAEAGARRLMLLETSRGQRRLESVANDLRARWEGIEITCSSDLTELRRAPLIVTATNDPRAIIRSSHVRAGAIVIDDAQPSDVHADVLARSDVATIAAGVVRVPGVRVPFFRGVFAEPEENFSCLAEVVALAAHGVESDFAIGIPTEREIQSIRGMAAQLEIERGSFQNSQRTYEAEEIIAIARRFRAN